MLDAIVAASAALTAMPIAFGPEHVDGLRRSGSTIWPSPTSSTPRRSSTGPYRSTLAPVKPATAAHAEAADRSALPASGGLEPFDGHPCHSTPVSVSSTALALAYASSTSRKAPRVRAPADRRAVGAVHERSSGATTGASRASAPGTRRSCPAALARDVLGVRGVLCSGDDASVTTALDSYREGGEDHASHLL